MKLYSTWKAKRAAWKAIRAYSKDCAENRAKLMSLSVAVVAATFAIDGRTAEELEIDTAEAAHIRDMLERNAPEPTHSLAGAHAEVIRQCDHYIATATARIEGLS